MGNIKEININNRTCYFFDDMINITNFDPKLLKIDKKSFKNIDLFILFIYLFYFFPKLQLQKNKQENIHDVTIMLQIMLQH